MRKTEAPKFLEPWRILVSLTSKPDYEMDRYILAHAGEDWEDEYLVIEGYHCSCYNFSDTAWGAVIYTREELIKLAKARISDECFYYSCETKFWKLVVDVLGLKIEI